MLIISGFPGFVTKFYAVNQKNGYWQGMYRWESVNRLEEYRKSLVFNIMNRRAITGSVKSFVVQDQNTDKYIDEKTWKLNQPQGSKTLIFGASVKGSGKTRGKLS
jgi:hypothetical protein